MTDRAVSSTLNYVLSLGIATLLITGLLLAGGSFVDDRRSTVVRTELSVIGQQLAADLTRADRLVTAGGPSPEVRIEQSLPERVTGAHYRVTLRETPSQRVVLNATDPDVSVTVRVTTRTPLRESMADGGTVVIAYSSNRLEVNDD